MYATTDVLFSISNKEKNIFITCAMSVNKLYNDLCERPMHFLFQSHMRTDGALEVIKGLRD